MERIALLSLGSNIENRLFHLQEALILISQKCGKVISKAPLYENEAIGFKSDTLFLNTAILIHTKQSPEELLASTQEIEKQIGRAKKTNGKYSSRKIDIDIIFFDNLILQTSSLTIPHPSFKNRNFVLTPLNDIAGSFIDPQSKLTLKELLNHCKDESELHLNENVNW